MPVVPATTTDAIHPSGKSLSRPRLRRSGCFTLLGALILVVAVLVVVEANTAFVQDLALEALMGTKRTRIPCAQWPTPDEARQAIDAHPRVVSQIVAVSPRVVSVEVEQRKRCPGRALIMIYFPGRREGNAIKSILGDESYFFGVPYEMRNI